MHLGPAARAAERPWRRCRDTARPGWRLAEENAEPVGKAGRRGRSLAADADKLVALDLPQAGGPHPRSACSTAAPPGVERARLGTAAGARSVWVRGTMPVSVGGGIGRDIGRPALAGGAGPGKAGVAQTPASWRAQHACERVAAAVLATLAGIDTDAADELRASRAGRGGRLARRRGGACGRWRIATLPPDGALRPGATGPGGSAGLRAGSHAGRRSRAAGAGHEVRRPAWSPGRAVTCSAC